MLDTPTPSPIAFVIRPAAIIPRRKESPSVWVKISDAALCLGVGQSFLVPGDTTPKAQSRVASAIWYQASKHGRKFVTRKEPGGIAVWRVS